MGSDGGFYGESQWQRAVSIHTPAWGVTPDRVKRSQECVSFNPHSRMGSDSKSRTFEQQQKRFNPHSRMGSD